MMIAAMMVAAVSANAQVWIGGEVGFNTSTNTVKVNGVSTDETTNNFTIAPEIGYNLSDKWAVAVKVAFAHSGNNAQVAALVANWGINNATTNAFAINPYARYTFVKFEKVNLFVDGGVGYTHTKAGDAKNNQFAIGLMPGVAVNLNEKLSFVAHVGFLGYENEKVKGDDKSTNTFGFDLNGNALSFGVYYNF